MASLQQTPISIQSKTPPSAQLSRSLLTPRPRNLSFSSSVPSLRLSASTRLAIRSSGGARMNATPASSYAGALVDIAVDSGSLDTIGADVEKLEKVFSEAEIAEYFANPTVDEDKKREVIDEIAAALGLQEVLVKFLYILVDANRTDIVADVIKEYEQMYNAMTDTGMAVVSSVVPLESEHLAQIAKQVQKLTGHKNVRIKSVIDPSLVAGFTVRFGEDGSQLIDMSVKKQLEEITAQLEINDLELAI